MNAITTAQENAMVWPMLAVLTLIMVAVFAYGLAVRWWQTRPGPHAPDLVPRTPPPCRNVRTLPAVYDWEEESH